MEEFLNVQKEIHEDECANCTRRQSKGEPEFKRCGACKNAYYCSRECQVKHWKFHKKKCAAYQETKASAGNKRRELRLFQEWRRQVKNAGILPVMMIYYFGWNRLARLQEDQSVISLTLRFDFNKKNFVPEAEPFIVKIDQVERFAEELRQIYNASAPSQTHEKCSIVIIPVVTDGSKKVMASISPFTIEKPESITAAPTWLQVQELLNNVQLESSKFAAWNTLLRTNLKISLQDHVVINPNFQPFLTNALRIESTQSLHKTHVLVFDMEMGYGLGEVKRLKSYSVKPVAKLIAQLERFHPNVRQQLDLLHHPVLMASRVQYPHNCHVPVVFFCPRTKVMFIKPNMMEVYPNHAIHPVRQCDKKAKAAFEKLQKIVFPKVKSPELH